MNRVLILGGTDAGRARIARQYRLHSDMHIDIGGPVSTGVSFLSTISYDVVVAFFESNLAARFAEACIVNRISPPLAVLAPGLRYQCAHLQRVLTEAQLPVAVFIRCDVEDLELQPILADLVRQTSAAAQTLLCLDDQAKCSSRG